MTDATEFSIENLQQLQGMPVYSSDKEQIGKVDTIYVDEDTRVPEWIGIGAGFFGSKRLLVPTQGAMAQSDGVHVRFDKATVESSPDVAGEEIPEDTERSLYDHYGVSYSDERSESTLPEGSQRGSASTGSDQASMTRSEEELRVGKRQREAGRVRLRKWVETEPVSEEVTLQRETAEVSREPINRPASAGEIGEQEVEVTLQSEEPVVEKATVAKEQVSVKKGTDTTKKKVSDEVQKERIEVDGEDVERVDK
jgi:uncharacterized protein (TIGR02271 family)